MDDAVTLMENWAAQPIAGMQVEVVQLRRPHAADLHRDPRRSGDDDCVLLYGHLDKQPEMTGWADGLGPWKPVIKGDKLYGRGGADDGYAIFGSLTAIMALQGAGHAARALRGADRGLRGIRQLRPALLRRPSGRAHRQARRWWSAWIRAAATTTSCGAPPRCAAWPAASSRSACSTKACTPAMPPAWCRRASACCASCCRGSRTKPPAHPASTSCYVRHPRAAHRAGRKRAAEVLGTRGLRQVPVPARHDADERRPDRAGAQPHLAPGAVDHRRGRPALAARTPATCCARTPR